MIVLDFSKDRDSLQSLQDDAFGDLLTTGETYVQVINDEYSDFPSWLSRIEKQLDCTIDFL